ncbi:MAG: nuclear transport factor 2 family protein [Flavobacteriaceae bacterium]|nr:nuclear transport factor 2 family protein [Flavobacteriaceae bacterium]
MKRLILVLLILILINFSCRNKSNTEIANVNLELAERSFAAFNAHNWEQHAQFFSDSCTYLDPSYGNEYVTKSRKEKIEKYRKMEMTSPDIKDDITSLFAVDDKVVVQFISSGTAKMETRDYMWSLPICCIFTFKDGIIIRDETYYNRGN